LKASKLGKKVVTYYLCIIVMSLTFISALILSSTTYPVTIEFTVKTGKPSYYMRESVDIYSNFMVNGSPTANLLIGLEIVNPTGLNTIYRTLQTNSSPEGPIIANITLGKIKSTFPLVFEPKTSFKKGDIMDLNITLQNTSSEGFNIELTVSVYDSTNTFLGLSAVLAKTFISGHHSLSSFATLGSEGIPSWASIGEATVYVNVFNRIGTHNIIPCSREKSRSFIIANMFGAESHMRSPIFNPSRINSTYNLTSRLGPYALPGQYRIYATSSYNYETVLETFTVQYADFPPQAIFTWAPPQPYYNQTVDFDASASTSSGGTITKYEWDWETDGSFDATGIINSTKYETPGEYNVTLKVTDSLGKWVISTRPITILPPSPPEADFTYLPVANVTVEFNASSTKLGWSGIGFSPIVSYEWDFGDSNITTVSSPAVTHKYPNPGVYNVTLNVTDARGWWDTTWQAINVTMSTGLPGDLNGDGCVDIFDLVIVAADFGRPIDPPLPIQNPSADINKDGVVDIFDLVIIAATFGSGCQ